MTCITPFIKSPIYVTKIDDDPLISWSPFFFWKEFFHGEMSEWVSEWVSEFHDFSNQLQNMISS